MKAKRILLVDDDPTTLLAVGNLLRRESYDVTTCSESAEGVSLALRGAWDLIVLDLDFGRPRPEMAGEFNGLTLLRWLRTAGRKTPVLLLTSSETEGLDRRAESVGATEVLRKSDPAQRMLEATRAALEMFDTPRVETTVDRRAADSTPPASELEPVAGFIASAVARVRAALNLFF